MAGVVEDADPYGEDARGAVCGPMWASAPTEEQQEVQWAGDRKGRPYESVTRGAVKRVVGGVRPCEFVTVKSPGA